MANVLPQGTQKEVWRLYRSRFVLTVSLFSLALSALACVALLPSYLALTLAAPPTAQIVPSKAGGTPDAATAIARAQTFLRTVSPVLASTSSPAALVEYILEQRPKGITVTRVTYDIGKYEVALVGSGTRTTINTYRDTLARDPLFTSVSVPVSALVGAGDGAFSMTVVLQHEQL